MSQTYGRVRSDRRGQTVTKCGNDWTVAQAQSETMRGEVTAWTDRPTVNSPGRLDFEAREMLGRDNEGPRLVYVTVYPRGADAEHPDEVVVLVSTQRAGVRVIVDGQA